MKLLIRADANNVIASGHIMRCIAIARKAISMGHEVKFVIADNNAEILINKHNMSYICMHTQWDDMENEIEVISDIIKKEKSDYILVDSYYVTKKYLSTLRDLCKVAYIDDLNMFKYPCDVLICYVNYYNKFNYEMLYRDDTTRLLLGPQYTPLRDEFLQDKLEANTEQMKSILVMSGGSDEYHIVKQILEEFDKYEITKSNKIVAICGVYNEDYGKLVEKYSDNENITLLKAVENIHVYMRNADIAISAGGTTLYELCACGTPTICYSLADNQLDNVKSFEVDGIMKYVGDVRYDNVALKIVEEIEELLNNEKKRMLIREKMFMVIDGKGTERIVREICR